MTPCGVKRRENGFRVSLFLLAALLGVLFAETWTPQVMLGPWLSGLPLSSSANKRAAHDTAAAHAELDALAAIVTTSAGVCHFFPRCLLYSCCSAGLLAATQSSFTARDVPARGTSPNAPLPARMQGHPLSGVTITKTSLEQGLASLLPTSPIAFSALRTRREFRVLYLAQGDEHRASLPQWYLRNMKDLLYLSFRNVTADFFFPDSNLCEGRMALYLAGRLLEIQQGWLYDYFVFLDDDVSTVTSDPLASFVFELDLLQWEPAIGGPFFIPGPPASKTSSVGSSAHIDFLYIAYHREILEVIHPWVFDFDVDCTWASQLLQTYEFALVARNHVLVSRDFGVGNSKHRDYTRNCYVTGGGPAHSGFPAVHADIVQKVGKQRAHCLPRTGILADDGFFQYIRAGTPRPRLSSYFLSSSTTFDDGCAGHPTDFANPACCAFEAFSPQITRSPHHNCVVKERNGNPSSFSFVWGSARWDFDGVDTLSALGFSELDVILLDASEISTLAPLDMRSTHSQVSGLPRATRISIGALLLVVSESGVAHLPSEGEALAALADDSATAVASSMALPFWRVRYLALSAAARLAVAEMQTAIRKPAAEKQLHAVLGAPWPLQPWFKIDFSFVTCFCPSCCSQGFPGWNGRGPDLARGDVTDPFFAGIPPSLAVRTLKLEDLISYLRLPPASHFVVNIGAACAFGGYADPTQRLFAGISDGAGLEVPVGGLLLDAHADPVFFSAYPRRPNVTLVAPITMEPSTIAATFGQYSVPFDFALLKVDVDSVDLGLISSLLAASYRPAVIHMEINTIFPPPLRFSIPLSSSYMELAGYGIEKLFGGVSLSAAADFLIPNGYRLVEVDGWDAVWIRLDLAEKLPGLPTSLSAAFKSGFLERVERNPHCFCQEILLRVINRDVWGLADEAVATLAAKDAAGAANVLQKVRTIIDGMVPRHPETGVLMHYTLGLTGPSDGLVA